MSWAELPGLVDSPEDRRLVSLVRPADWVKPAPRGRYNLVVLGGGTAGLVSAMGAAGLGARVALCERELLGGDCLAFGCVPSKALLRSAHAAHAARNASSLGVSSGSVEVDGPAVFRRLRHLRADIAPHDAAARVRDAGVDVYLESARFTGHDSVEVNGATLRFSRAVIATGSRARVPEVPGLAEAGYLTNVTVFALSEPPPRLVVIGAGPIGCELSQAFARLGSQVTLLGNKPQILPRDDHEAAECVAVALRRELRLELAVRVRRVERRGEVRVVEVEQAGRVFVVEGEEVLVATGRTPNIEGLGLEAAGVGTTPRGIATNDFLRTSNRRVYAAGDVAGRWAFTHAADAMGRVVVRNALFFGRSRVSGLHVPWCTYTDPELGQVGLTLSEAQARGAVTLTTSLERNNRAVIDGQTEGFARVHLDPRRGTILGATFVGAGAGDAIGEMAVARQAGLRMEDLSATIHPYPTRIESWRRLGDDWQRAKLTPRVAGLLRRFLSLRR